MKSTPVILVFALALMASVPSSHAFQASHTQSAQAQVDDFDGNWVGSGRIARTAFRTRCGDGPLVELTIQDGTAKVVFKFTTKGRSKSGFQRPVFILKGVVASDGKLEVSDRQFAAMAVLSAKNGSGEGTWVFHTRVCDGTFRVRRKP